MALAVEFRHAVRVVTAIRAELLARFHLAKARGVRALFWTFGLMLFSEHTVASLEWCGKDGPQCGLTSPRATACAYPGTTRKCGA
jgi:hypothetical protein